MMISEEGK